MILLVAGVGTNLSTLGPVARIMGARTAVVYAASVCRTKWRAWLSAERVPLRSEVNFNLSLRLGLGPTSSAQWDPRSDLGRSEIAADQTAELRVTRVIPTASPNSILEGVLA